MPAYSPGILDAKDNLFLKGLATTGQVAKAARQAQVDRSYAYVRRLNDPVFAERWAEALDSFCESLEAEAHRRAVLGVEEPVIYQGSPTYQFLRDVQGRPLKDEDGSAMLDLDEHGNPKVLTVRKYSDSLLALMLKSKLRREYGDSSKVELTGADGGPVQIEDNPLQSARKIAFALALGVRAAAEQQQPDDGSDLA